MPIVSAQTMLASRAARLTFLIYFVSQEFGIFQHKQFIAKLISHSTRYGIFRKFLLDGNSPAFSGCVIACSILKERLGIAAP